MIAFRLYLFLFIWFFIIPFTIIDTALSLEKQAKTYKLLKIGFTTYIIATTIVLIILYITNPFI